MTFEKKIDLTKPPEGSKRENTYEIMKKVATSAVPFGGVVEVFIDEVIKPPSQKRLEEWIITIAEEVEKLKKNIDKFQYKNLKNNQEFISIFHQALAIAKITHQEEKIQALKNAVINSVLDNTLDASIKSIFLSLIENLTPWHLKILDYFNDPKSWFIKNNMTPPELVISGSNSQLLFKAFPGLEKGFAEFIIEDLHLKGLLGISKSNLNVSMTPSGPYQRGTSSLGKQFLTFIKKHEIE